MQDNKCGYIYILSNERQTVYYVGVTSDICRRVYEHRNHLIDGFTAKYNVTKVLYVETTESIEAAILREKQLKGWTRSKKMALIETKNPTYQDLYDMIMSD